MIDVAATLYTATRTPYLISTDPTLLDLDTIHDYLHHSYWSPGVPREVVQKAIAHSLNFGLYHQVGDQLTQVGFGRVVTDYASFAYLADVFVLSEHRGQQLGVWLVETIVGCPALHSLRSFILATRDAHTLYDKVGFEPIDSTRYMIKRYDIPWRDATLARE